MSCTERRERRDEEKGIRKREEGMKRMDRVIYLWSKQVRPKHCSQVEGRHFVHL